MLGDRTKTQRQQNAFHNVREIVFTTKTNPVKAFGNDSTTGFSLHVYIQTSETSERESVYEKEEDETKKKRFERPT